MGTTLSSFNMLIISPSYMLNFMKTAMRSESDPYFSNRMSYTIFITSFTNSDSVQILAVNITRDLFASTNSASSPFTMLKLTFLASHPLVCIAMILATGFFKNQSIFMLILSISS